MSNLTYIRKDHFQLFPLGDSCTCWLIFVRNLLNQRPPRASQAGGRHRKLTGNQPNFSSPNDQAPTTAITSQTSCTWNTKSWIPSEGRKTGCNKKNCSFFLLISVIQQQISIHLQTALYTHLSPSCASLCSFMITIMVKWFPVDNNYFSCCIHQRRRCLRLRQTSHGFSDHRHPFGADVHFLCSDLVCTSVRSCEWTRMPLSSTEITNSWSNWLRQCMKFILSKKSTTGINRPLFLLHWYVRPRCLISMRVLWVLNLSFEAHRGTLWGLRINVGHVLNADYCEQPTASLILLANVQEGESLSCEGLQLFVGGFYRKVCQLLY